MSQWVSAERSNRLATAADWACRFDKCHGSDDELHDAATQLDNCLGQAYLPEIASQSAATFAALCAAQMGWAANP